MNYAYNGEGARLKQIVNSAVTTYTQDLAAPLPVVLQSKTGANTMQYVYALGTRPLAQYGGAWEYLLADALGSARQIADANGNVTLAESYQPYGSVLKSTGTASSIFAYAGEETDIYIKLFFAIWLSPLRASNFWHIVHKSLPSDLDCAPATHLHCTAGGCVRCTCRQLALGCSFGVAQRAFEVYELTCCRLHQRGDVDYQPFTFSRQKTRNVPSCSMALRPSSPHHRRHCPPACE